MTLSGEKIVSIIIPVYNAERDLHNCLDSIKRQTYRKLEIIFINDCSTDSTLEQLNSFYENERNNFSINIINHTENSGVAVARNTGIKHASGDYVYFIDSDDIMESNTIETLLQAAITSNFDIVGSEWYLSFEKSERAIQQPDVNDGRDAFVKMCYGAMRWNLWLFLIKRSLFEENKIEFIPKMNMGEDMMVMMKLMLCTDRVKVLHTPLYHYNQNNTNSLTRKYFESRGQIEANVAEIERFTALKNSKLVENVFYLKLALKLPMLISPKIEDYKKWESWFNDANVYVGANKGASAKTKLLEWSALHKQYWILKLYYYLVIKFLYGVIYK